MADECSFKMKVVGDDKNSIEKFIRAMNWEGEYEECGVGRVYECDKEDEIQERTDGKFEVYLIGTCAWSLYSSMIESFMHSLTNKLSVITKDLRLKIEAYSEECGCEFQEHVIYDNGKELICDCVDWKEVDLCYDGEKYDEEEFIDIYEMGYDEFFKQDKYAKYIEKGKTYKDYELDGYVRLGGYNDWKFSI